jgi:hypothetical protein
VEPLAANATVDAMKWGGLRSGKERGALLLLPVILGCGSTQDTSFGHSDAGKQDAADDVSSHADAAPLPDASPDAGGPLVCSEDLHHVLDSKGNSVQQCIPTEGCANGICVPACQAAAAAHGSLGCDFAIATPSFYPNPTGTPCFAVALANAWGLNATVQFSLGGASYSANPFTALVSADPASGAWPTPATSGLPSGEVGILSLGVGGFDTCIFTPPFHNGGPGEGVFTGNAAATGVGEAFHVVTSVPVTAYDFMGHENGSLNSGAANACLTSTTSPHQRQLHFPIDLLA